MTWFSVWFIGFCLVCGLLLGMLATDRDLDHVPPWFVGTMSVAVGLAWPVVVPWWFIFRAPRYLR